MAIAKTLLMALINNKTSEKSLSLKHESIINKSKSASFKHESIVKFKNQKAIAKTLQITFVNNKMKTLRR